MPRLVRCPQHCLMTGTAYSAYGLILSEDRHRAGLGSDVLRRAAQRGELIRLRRGAYCDASHWNELDARQRYLLRIRAVAAAADEPPVLCSWSAAAVWGMPVLDGWPEEVHVLARPANGGRSKNGVRRHPMQAHRWHEAGVTERDGLLLTGIAHTALDLVLATDFAPAVATLDWALWRKNQFRVGIADVRAELERRAPRYRAGHAEAVLAQGTHLSDSFGESMGRAVVLLLGYPAPELQARFVDAQGEMFVDYLWRAQGIAGEFDGAAKYMRREYRKGLSPGEVVWREKKRDDRLRRQLAGTVRIIWSEVCNPPALDRMLREAGLRPERSRLPPRDVAAPNADASR